ncbi:single-stranded DNA-binding protein [Varibaculum cambriense]|uniref:single-stranded DNA-binding protein n=1 Tax=Varibaculum cambriense TaxID=184870 RepID=UPI0029090206|nr:single-stranded DNA-binding protein [Varibaculum cambriense]MDU5542160.1 single-stranded DNA-binding protein [Varibaculum cambriense]
MSKANIEVTFTGWVATAPTFHRPDPTKPEKALSTFRVMHTPYSRDNQGNWQKGESLTVRVKVWGWGAHYVSRSIRVGDPIIVCGRLIRSKWQDKEQVTHYGLELTASSLGHDLTMGESNFVRMVGALPKRGNFATPSKEGEGSLADPEGEFETTPAAEPAGTEATGADPAGIKPAPAAGDQVIADPNTGEILEAETKSTHGSNPPAPAEESAGENALDSEGEYILETTFSGEAA